MSDHAGVLNLAGEFVHSYYQLLVSDQFASTVDFYSENAVLTRGIGGTKATSSQSVSSEINAMHSKLKEGTTEIVSIDAVQLESQNIVITVVVAFKSINTVVAQTLVLEAKSDEDGQPLWFIVNDMLRYLPSNALFGASASKGGARNASAVGDKAKAKNTSAKPAAEPSKPVEENSVAPAAAVVATPTIVSAPAASTAVPAAAETKVESAPVAVQTHITKPKNDRSKKSGGAGDKSGAVSTSPHAPAANAASEKPAVTAPPKKEEPKTWAARAAAAAAAAAATPTTTEDIKPVAAVVATTPAAPAAAEEKPHRHANVTATATAPSASTTSSASNDLHVFIRAPAELTAESIREKFASFGATIVDLELKGEKSAIIALQTEDKEALFTHISSVGPISINGTTLSSIEKSRTAPNSSRFSSASSSRGSSRGGRSSPSSSSSPATSSSNGRDANRGGRRPAGGNPIKRD